MNHIVIIKCYQCPNIIVYKTDPFLCKFRCHICISISIGFLEKGGKNKMSKVLCFDDTTSSIKLRIYTDMPTQLFTLPLRPDTNLAISIFRCVTLPDHSYIYTVSLNTDQAVFKLKYWILFDVLIPYCLYSEACNRCEDLNLTFKAIPATFHLVYQKRYQVKSDYNQSAWMTRANLRQWPTDQDVKPNNQVQAQIRFHRASFPPDSSKGSEGTSFHHQRHVQENNT